MASSYPGGYDSLAKPTATTKEDDAGFEHDIVHSNEAYAIEAVESTLGVNPQGASATVKARLDAVDTSLAGKVGTSDARLTDARTPTAHAASHGSAGSDVITLAQSQVTNLTTDLAGKVGTSRTVSTTAPLSGGGDLSADRTLTIADGTTAQKGAVQLTDSTSSTSTTTAATPNAVKSAYDLATTANTAAGTAQTTANAAVPKSTVTTTGDLIVATGSAAVTRLAAGTSGQVLTANGAGVAPTYQAAAGDGKVVVQTNSHTPNNATGNNGDMMITAYDAGTSGAVFAKVVGPKAAGAWPASDAINSGGDRVFLPLRSKTMKNADLISGWRMDFDTTWATGTVPSDLTKDGTFGGAWYSSSAGTYAGMARYRQAAGAPLAFFSGQFTITTLPESGRFFIFGNGISAGGWYGYGLRIESTGAATIRLIDPFIGPTDLALATGMTVAVNDTIVFERFGWRLTAYKTSGTGRTLLGPENATATNRPMNALIDPTRGAYYADLYSGSSFGLATNSASVRVSNVYFAG